MKVLMLMLTLICWSFVAAIGEKVLPSNGFEQDAKKGVDVVNHPSCNRLKEKGFCYYRFIKNKLCHATCNCDNILSKPCCEALKGKNECNKAIAKRYCKETCGLCSCKQVALGMQSRAIPDSSITSSSIYDNKCAAYLGRLHSKYNYGKDGKAGAWIAKYNRAGQWIRIDLGKVTMVTAVATQGRYDASQWVTSYTLQYSNDGRSFKNYQGGKVFTANVKDQHTVVKHALRPSITARYIRLVVKTWYNHICLRMELYGCKR